VNYGEKHLSGQWKMCK